MSTNEYPVKSTTAPSPEFEDATVSRGSCAITCELCGRQHYGDDLRADGDAGEYAEAVKAAKADPEGHQFRASSSVSWGVHHRNVREPSSWSSSGGFSTRARTFREVRATK